MEEEEDIGMGSMRTEGTTTEKDLRSEEDLVEVEEQDRRHS